MLSELQIENIAVIKKATIPFTDGLNVMTGESGTGKSIVIDSINAVLGERTSRELIRTECDYGFVSALFYDNRPHITSVLEELSIPTEEGGTILIQRRITSDGRNHCKINGTTVTVGTIKQVGRLLLNIHGQADNQSLLDAQNHRSYVDSLAQNKELRQAYRKSFDAYKAAQKAYEALNLDENDKLRRLDILNYQIEELEAAQITVGETEEIEEKLALLRNAEHITNALQTAYALLNGDEEGEGAASLSMRAVHALEGIEGVTAEYAQTISGIREASYNLSAYCDDLRDALDSDVFDISQADALEERLDLLSQLRRKYGDTEEEMLEFLDKAKEEEQSIALSDETKAKLQKEMDEKKQTAIELALELRKTRQEAAIKFKKDVANVLAFLDMPSVRFTVEFKPLDVLTPFGMDEVEFFLSANAGEDLKPLSKIASGGELSRIMLAIKSVLAEKDKIDTLIFDEIDTGVSGRAAQKIAIQLKELSKTHQVICVTHLAQIAAYGDAHLQIQKFEKNGKTYTELTPLDFEGRKQELARILGGLTVTDLQLQNAEELLNQAKI